MTLLTMIVKMGEGLSKTCAIFFLTLLFSLPLGMIVALLRMSKNRIVSGITRFFISILRGTPLMLQLLAVTYGPFYLFGASVARNKLVPIIVGFSVNYAAYFAEIYRGGIDSMPAGQYEAAAVLGYSRFQTFMRIILPQVIKRILPSITNEVITLVKDTSIARIISMQELIYSGYAFLKGSHGYSGLLWPIFFTGVYYLAFNGILTLLFGRIEKRLQYFS